jgi:hypothetical protein
MTDMSAAPERARAGGRQTLIDGYDLVAALDRAAGNQVTTISAPAGSGKPRCYAHGPTDPAGRAGSRSCRYGRGSTTRSCSG